MSSYRDDTQETMVIADAVFTKVTTDVVENLKIVDKESATITSLINDMLVCTDDISETKVGIFDDSIKIEADVIDHQVAKHLVLDTVRAFDQTHLTFKATAPIIESIAIQDISFHHLVSGAYDVFSIQDMVFTKVTAKNQIIEKLKAVDSVTSNNHIIEAIEDTTRVVESFSFKYQFTVNELLRLSDATQQQLHAQKLSVDIIKIKDRLANVSQEFIFDSIGITESVPAKTKYKDQISDQILVSSELLARKRIYESIDDQMSLTDTSLSALHAKQWFDDLLFIDDVLPQESLSGVAWTAGCDAWYMSRYADFSYTQLAVINGELFAVCDTGIHQLIEGAQAVSAKIITPKLDLGAGALTHPLGAYLEYELSGISKKLDVGVTTTQSGSKQKYNYTLATEKADELTNGRVLFGRGLRGRHFAFEVNMNATKGYVNDLSIDLSSTKRRV